MADKKSETKKPAAEAGLEPEQSLGQFITDARERKGMTREQVVAESHLPAHYVKMIETDNYGMISDQLYLVPFLRRYATFLGLDAEDVASRFVSQVQHAESTAVRISQPLTMVVKRRRVARGIAFAVLIAAVIVLAADFAWRHLVRERDILEPTPLASPAAVAPPTLPPSTIVVPPAPAGLSNAPANAPATGPSESGAPGAAPPGKSVPPPPADE